MSIIHPMKKGTFFVLVVVLIAAGMLWGCSASNNNIGTSNGDRPILRLHIRANSDSADDQAVKYTIRDDIIAFLEPRLGGAVSSSQAKDITNAHMHTLLNITRGTLSSHGFSYGATIRLSNEFFPTRSYGGIVFGSGYYYALIIELGSGTGANWWCVIYPPLCFIGRQSGTSGFRYRSIIRDLWNRWLG